MKLWIPTQQADVNLRIQLGCSHPDCGEQTWAPNPHFALTKNGVLRVIGGVPPGWAVNGNGGWCPEHSGPVLEHDVQREPWDDYDRRHVESILEDQEDELGGVAAEIYRRLDALEGKPPPDMPSSAFLEKLP